MYYLCINRVVLVASEDVTSLCMMAIQLHKACNVKHLIRVCDKDANCVLRLELDKEHQLQNLDVEFVESFID